MERSIDTCKQRVTEETELFSQLNVLTLPTLTQQVMDSPGK